MNDIGFLVTFALALALALALVLFFSSWGGHAPEMRKKQNQCQCQCQGQGQGHKKAYIHLPRRKNGVRKQNRKKQSVSQTMDLVVTMISR